MPSYASDYLTGFRDTNTNISTTPTGASYRANTIDDFEEFRRLVNAWRIETHVLPSVKEKLDNPNFSKLRTLGRKAIPWVLSEVKYTPDFLVLLLSFLVPENPIPEVLRGKIGEITNFWLSWAERNGVNVD